jgi:hypothetical protein
MCSTVPEIKRGQEGDERKRSPIEKKTAQAAEAVMVRELKQKQAKGSSLGLPKSAMLFPLDRQ